MTTNNDGGPAFPGVCVLTDGVWDGPGTKPGMSLRDYFAGLAMQAIIAKFPPQTCNTGLDELDLMMARGAYEYADAMLAERAKKGGAQ